MKSLPHVWYINNIENIQRRFNKRLFIREKLSYDDRLKSLNLDRLELRRIHFDACMAYNILENLPYHLKIFMYVETSTKTRSALTKMLTSDKFRLDIKKFGFSNRSYKLWNSIFPEIKQSRNLNEFKRKLHTIGFSPFLKGRKYVCT